MAELPHLVLRAATKADAQQIAAVHVAAWRAGYAGIFSDEWLGSDEFATARRERWREWRLGPAERVAVATLAESSDSTPIVTAFSWYGPERDRGRGAAGRGEINAFYADPRVWGTGVAAALMDHSELRLRAEGFTSAVLWVLADNPRARRFYERHGWAPTGIAGEFEMRGTRAPEVEYRKQLTP
ncbi:MAG TPA: GNAT family N-acetyltransferase [Ilumatobacter sp.]|nr:GNAT family N-acetyltransferase [Ilumatobacter sp.]